MCPTASCEDWAVVPWASHLAAKPEKDRHAKNRVCSLRTMTRPRGGGGPGSWPHARTPGRGMFQIHTSLNTSSPRAWRSTQGIEDGWVAEQFPDSSKSFRKETEANDFSPCFQEHVFVEKSAY